MATWSTTSAVLDITGAEVTDAQLNQAESVIVIYANRTPDTANLRVRDLYWLGQAVAWQAAWMPEQPGYNSRNQHRTVSGDGQSVSVDTEHAVTLAPLAARSLKNLSWKADKTRRGRPINDGVGAAVTDFRLESSDDQHGWKPL